MSRELINRTILVVEDDLAIGSFLEIGLEDSGYIVQLISDGRLALQRIPQIVPALIVLDMQLPSLNGDQVLMCVRASEALRSIPVIVMSAFRELPESVHHHAHAILMKPFHFERLLELIARWVPPPTAR